MAKFNRDQHPSDKSSNSSHDARQSKGNFEYVGAPYNFIDFPRRWVARYDGFEQLPPHDRYGDGLLSGSIDLKWKAETPVFIGHKEEGFFRNHQGFAIPGSSMRGMIRSHIQILGMCNYRDDIENQWFLYRDMASRNQRLKAQYRANLGIVSHNIQSAQQQERGALPDKLKAGYVEKGEDGKYYIFPAQQDKKGVQMYRISERHLRRMKLPPDKVKLMYKKEFWEQDINKLTPQDINKEYYDKHGYRPYYVPVCYTMDAAKGKVGKIVIKDAVSAEGQMEEGYLLSSGYMYAGKSGKLTHYIIRAAEENIPGRAIDKTYVDAYNTDLIRKKYKGNERLDKEYEFYHLPEEAGRRKPIFYVETAGKITYFGFTPYLRIFYDYSVHQGIPQAFRAGDQLDYCKSLFGFSAYPSSNDGELAEPDAVQAYKSRISFEDMQAVGNPCEMDPIPLILAEPKATAYPLYLKQPDAPSTGELATYNEPNFTIRGMKRYWFKEEERLEKNHKKNDRILSYLRPLPKDTYFQGRIRFSNLAQDELGLLLWAIMLEAESKVQIGKGKPYGYGRMKLKREEVILQLEDLAIKYGSRLTFASDYLKPGCPEKYIQAYWKYMQEKYQIDIRQEPHVQSFLMMAKQVLRNEQVRYMEIERQANGEKNNEYKGLHPLSSVKDVVEGKVVRRATVRRSNKSSGSSGITENGGKSKSSRSKTVTGCEISATDNHNELQVKDLPAWKVKLMNMVNTGKND
ncbi:TIGR03986 family CRISPR-associated RAMP protein [Desulforamulus ruminis]|uniref:CRISPR type III-associated protein domain-containing protein n=1 Tax=Desulforamulus ruminis (strain ATCC 23193 / DSM 2154 / NCIMB 8452 / DL) TaxID=696281 RepID=F6DMF9_DESRL|nr:TIGR03986 family CRISPR-associated RAMP protein [Desulforamulus ruminis]AEG61720.1 hypothetical protein Desru_3517 [Desulforamulus ruminis DSM 2154]